MKIATPGRLAAIFLWLVTASGCEVENNNSVTCMKKDCQASCLQSGFPGGACAAGGRCACLEGNTDPFHWTPPSTDLDGGDASSPAPLPDGGAVSGVGAP